MNIITASLLLYLMNSGYSDEPRKKADQEKVFPASMLKHFVKRNDVNLTLFAKNGLIFHDVYLEALVEGEIFFLRPYGTVREKINEFKSFKIKSSKKVKDILILKN